ncbi:glutamine-dependent NAD(+) synthetase [Dinochytrium kinnereticum]|nr:glutamine-dependent NAD(+) synthetase [Dinochytrium kinnereticum]
MELLTVSTCSLNQWALDFTGNRKRTLESIKIAKQSGAIYRLGPELEITAGRPVMHYGVKYNCRVIFYNKRILLIRPKMFLANDGNYRELRWFSPWMKTKRVEDFVLPTAIQSVCGQVTVPFGDGVISFHDASFGTEVCEELFTPESPHIQMALNGVEIFTNGSGSHHEFGKLKTRVDLLLSATAKSGGIYLYANQQGCDGERTYYDGCALIAVNGEIVAHGSQFSLADVEVVTATVDLAKVRSFRSAVSRSFQAVSSEPFPRISVNESICRPLFARGHSNLSETLKKTIKFNTLQDEIRGDWARLAGFGTTSEGLKAGLVSEAIAGGDEQVLADVRMITGDPSFIPKDARDLSGRIFYTGYMGSKNSSTETRDRAKRLAQAVSSYHVDFDIDTVTSSVLSIFEVATGKKPIFKIFGGSDAENLALQNIQARTRMVLSYLFAQLLPWALDRPKSLLVLGSANVDETLRGYFTKYDCSSADINPIGGISKEDLRQFIGAAETHFSLPILSEFLHATPTAELEPLTESYTQSDEADMGMTYQELSIFGTLRKVTKCGPYQMFVNLLGTWNNLLSPREVAAKTTILPPSYHMSPYSPDDNRFDLRPILYNSGWTWQFSRIDATVFEIENQ